MKKIINYKTFLVAFVVSVSMFSCTEPDNETGDVKFVKPVVTANQTNFTLTEGETASITLTTDTPLNQDMTFKLEIVGGTATFRDYMCSGSETTAGEGFGPIGHIVTLPAFASSATFDITPIFDLLPEGSENLQLRLYSDSYSRGLIAEGSDMINISIANKTSDDFVVVFDFTQNYYDSFGSLVEPTYVDNTANAADHAFCELDFDLEIYDEFLTTPLFDSYSSCPESITLDATTPDGTYVVVPSLYTTAGNAVPAIDFFFKTKITMAKPGVWVKDININTNWLFSAGGAVQGNPNAYYPVATLVKTGTTYVLTDFNTGDVLASGKVANFKLKNKKNKI
jgi:hypothetical protein